MSWTESWSATISSGSNCVMHLRHGSPCWLGTFSCLHPAPFALQHLVLALWSIPLSSTAKTSCSISASPLGSSTWTSGESSSSFSSWSCWSVSGWSSSVLQLESESIKISPVSPLRYSESRLLSSLWSLDGSDPALQKLCESHSHFRFGLRWKCAEIKTIASLDRLSS